jgi:hypothetical protein
VKDEPFRPGIDIEGRPDLGPKPRFEYWKPVKKWLPYVHSTTANSCLIHKVECAEIRWYEPCYGFLQRLQHPQLLARTVCGRSVFLTNGKKSGKMCIVPDPNAVLCGRCHGELPTFSKRRKDRILRKWAHDHLGCKGVVEVIGPYQPPEQTQ